MQPKINEIQYINNSEWGETPLLEPLITRVLDRFGIYPENPVVIDDWDLDRVCITVDGQEYDIRTWNISEDEDSVTFEWTLFWMKEDEDHGTELGSGTSCILAN